MIVTLLIGIATVLLYGFACTCAGTAMTRLLIPEHVAMGERPASIRLALAFLLGQGLVSQVLVLAGLAVDGFSRILVVVVIAVCIALGSRYAVNDFVKLSTEIAVSVREWWDERDGWRFIGVGVLAFLVVLGLAAYVFPPVDDAEAYYFVYGKFIAAGGRLLPLRGNYELVPSFGLLGEIHYAALLLLADPHSVKLFVWFIAVATCLVLVDIGRMCGLGARGRIVVMALILTSTTFSTYITDGKVELFAAGLGLAAYWWAVTPVDRARNAGTARMAGILTGFACVAKLSYIPTLLPGVMLLLWLRPVGPAVTRVRLAALGNLAVAVVIAVIPHVIKNAVFSGEPLAPFVTSAASRRWHEQAWFNPQATRWILGTYPLALIFGRYPMQGGTLSHLWLALLPLALFLPRPTRWLGSSLVKITAASLLGVMTWVLLRPSVFAPRYLLATFVLLFLPAAAGTEYLSSRNAGSKILNAVIVGCIAFTMLARFVPFATAPVEVVQLFGDRLPECYRASPYCKWLAPLRKAARPGDRALTYLYYTYWTPPDMIVHRETLEEERAIRNIPDAASRWQEIQDCGFRFILIDRVTHAWAMEAYDPSAAPRSMHIRQLDKDGQVAIFEIGRSDTSKIGLLDHERNK